MGIEELGLRGIRGQFFLRLEQLLADIWAGQVSMEFGSDSPREEYKWLGMSPGLKEWIGGRDAKGLRANGIIIPNLKFESTLEIGVDELRRDKTSQIQIRIDDLAIRVSEHWHELLSANILANTLAYDGVTFFGTTHAEGESGVQLNDLAAAQVGQLNIVTPNNPTVAEFSDVIPKIVERFIALKDDQGQFINSGARSFLVMVPTNMWAAAAGALNLQIITDGAGARNNLVVNLGGFSFSLEANPRFDANDDQWYMYRTDGSAKPYIRQSELFETSQKDDSFDNDRFLFGVKALRNVGNGFWQHAMRMTFS